MPFKHEDVTILILAGQAVLVDLDNAAMNRAHPVPISVPDKAWIEKTVLS